MQIEKNGISDVQYTLITLFSHMIELVHLIVFFNNL